MSDCIGITPTGDRAPVCKSECGPSQWPCVQGSQNEPTDSPPDVGESQYGTQAPQAPQGPQGPPGPSTTTLQTILNQPIYVGGGGGLLWTPPFGIPPYGTGFVPPVLYTPPYYCAPVGSFFFQADQANPSNSRLWLSLGYDTGTNQCRWVSFCPCSGTQEPVLTTESGQISGHVYDFGGDPMPGVTVNLYGPAGTLVDSEVTQLETGAYFFGDLPMGDYVVEVDPIEGCQAPVQSEPASLTVADHAAEVDFYLDCDDGDAEGGISGTVYEDGGLEYVSGVTIQLLGDSAGQQALIDSTQTDESGTYSFSPLPAGTYTVRCVPPAARFIPDAENDVQVTLTAADPNATVNFTLHYPYISGKVSYQATNTPVPGVQVALSSPVGSASVGTGSATTDADGAFRFKPVAFGLHSLTVTAPANYNVVTPPPHPRSVTVSAPNPESFANYFLLSDGTQGPPPPPAGGSITVYTIHQDNSEAPNVAFSWSGDATGSASTNNLGSYVISNLPVGTFTITCPSATGSQTQIAHIFTANGSTEVFFTVAGGGGGGGTTGMGQIMVAIGNNPNNYIIGVKATNNSTGASYQNMTANTTMLVVAAGTYTVSLINVPGNCTYTPIIDPVVTVNANETSTYQTFTLSCT